MSKKNFFLLLITFMIGLIIISNAINRGTNDYTKTDGSMDTQKSSVAEIDENEFEKLVLKSNKKVLVDFYADWCGPCKALSPLVAEVANENKGVAFYKVNVDNNKALSGKYGIRYIPTLIVFENGKVKKTSTGYIEKAEIEKLIK